MLNVNLESEISYDAKLKKFRKISKRYHLVEKVYYLRNKNKTYLNVAIAQGVAMKNAKKEPMQAITKYNDAKPVHDEVHRPILAVFILPKLFARHEQFEKPFG